MNEIENLQAQVAQWQTRVLALEAQLNAMCSALGLEQWTPGDELILSCNGLQIVDDAGKQRVLLGVQDEAALLALCGEDEAPRVILSAENQQGTLQFLDNGSASIELASGAEPQLILRLDSQALPSVVLKARAAGSFAAVAGGGPQTPHGGPMAMLQANETTAALTATDTNGKPRLLAGWENEITQISFRDENDSLRWLIKDEASGAQLVLFNETKQCFLLKETPRSHVFSIFDKEGAARAILTCQGEGEGGLILKSQSGNSSVLTALKSGPQLTLHAGGHTVAALGTEEKGGELQLFQPDGALHTHAQWNGEGGILRVYSENRNAALVAQRDHALVSAQHNDAVQGVVLTSTEVGGALYLTGETGAPRALLSVIQDGGTLELQTSGSERRVLLAAHETQGSLSIFDDEENIIAQMP